MYCKSQRAFQNIACPFPPTISSKKKIFFKAIFKMQPHNPAQRHCKTSMLPSLAVLANGFTSIKCNILGRATQTRMSYLHGCPFPESRAPEDAARSPPRHSTLSSHDPHSQHSHMVTSMRKIIWPPGRHFLQATASPAGAEESEGEKQATGSD